MRFAWIDLREVPRPQLQAVVDAAVHARMAGVLSADAELLGTLPPTVTRILAVEGPAPVAAVMAAGCRGLAVGRRIFSAPSPYALVSQLSALVHGGEGRPGADGVTDGMSMTESDRYSTIVAGVA